ncbi:alpha/beta hydrolase [Amphritea balenae]|uniref:Alpha/beta fold hydrolase n=1 Tax=Amphritea balenae TaxID=452629 RepID=A0A3P1SV46_9GAMM|nr:alpha/beta fold hydrolase [Amphritea balenae]RRD01031.1 alpha/beta fold hydrolase [Amphritea balenae]
MLRLTGLLVICYSALLLWIYFNQQGMLYFPNQFRPSPEQAQVRNLQLWPGSDDEYRGLLINPEQASATAIVFHGNAGTAWDRRFYALALSRLNYRVILVEYPGYGGRSGKPSETTIIADALDTIELARQQFPGPVTLWGESLGAAVAAASTEFQPDDARKNAITAVVMITPWYSLPELAQALYWYLPARRLTREQYNNMHSLANFKGRTALLIATEDEIIPNRQSLQLYDALHTTKKLWTFDGADHNSWPTSPDNAWWSEVDHFIKGSE